MESDIKYYESHEYESQYKIQNHNLAEYYGNILMILLRHTEIVTFW